MMMDESDGAAFRESHEELYGLLLLANQKIYNVGTMLIWVMGSAALALCVTIHMRWMPAVLGVPVDELRGFGVYTLIFLTTFLLFYWGTSVRERQLYQEMKPEILGCSQDHGLSVQSLLARIADDDELSDIRDQLMDDASIQPDSRRR